MSVILISNLVIDLPWVINNEFTNSITVSDLYNMPGLKTLATYQIYSVLSADNVVVLFREAVEHLPVLSEYIYRLLTFKIRPS